MVEVRALREAEPWSGASIAFVVVFVLAMLVVLAWLIRQYLRD